MRDSYSFDKHFSLAKLYILLFLLGINKISCDLIFYNFVLKGTNYIEEAQVGAFKA